MDLKEVLRIVSEIILNLIGSDHFAIWCAMTSGAGRRGGALIPACRRSSR
jgi:hypothetical protein